MKRTGIITRVLAVMIVSIASFIIGYYLYHIHLEEEMVFNITEDVIVINDLITRMYLVKTDNGYLAIDTGFSESIMKRGLDIYDINPEDVSAVLLTHADFDHVGGLELFQSADKYLSSAEAVMVEVSNGKQRLFPLLSSKLNAKECILLEDKQIFYYDGRKVEGILIPGHTPGSMGYLIDDIYLFTGDAFRIKNGKLTVPLKKMFLFDLEEMESSLRKIATYKGIRYIFSSHSGFTADFDYAVSEWRDKNNLE